MKWIDIFSNWSQSQCIHYWLEFWVVVNAYTHSTVIAQSQLSHDESMPSLRSHSHQNLWTLEKSCISCLTLNTVFRVERGLTHSNQKTWALHHHLFNTKTTRVDYIFIMSSLFCWFQSNVSNVNQNISALNERLPLQDLMSCSALNWCQSRTDIPFHPLKHLKNWI